jgi:hypothetical protein
METRRLLRDEMNSFGSVLGKHSLFIMILIIVFLNISVFFHCTIIDFGICLIDAVQGGISRLMLKKRGVGGFCFVGHSVCCIKTKPEPSFSFVSDFWNL